MKIFYSVLVLTFVSAASVITAVKFQHKDAVLSEVFTPMQMEVKSSSNKFDSEQSANKSDISVLLSKANSQYLEGNKSKAVDGLQEIINTIREKQSTELTNLLPKTVDGWSIRTDALQDKVVEPVDGQAVAWQEFVNNDKLIKISIIIGSPTNKEIYELATLSDGSGGLGDYNGYITKFYRSPESNKLVIVAGQNAVVEIEGFQLSHTGSLKIADSINLAEILTYANK